MLGAPNQQLSHDDARGHHPNRCSEDSPPTGQAQEREDTSAKSRRARAKKRGWGTEVSKEGHAANEPNKLEPAIRTIDGVQRHPPEQQAPPIQDHPRPTSKMASNETSSEVSTQPPEPPSVSPRGRQLPVKLTCPNGHAKERGEHHRFLH